MNIDVQIESSYNKYQIALSGLLEAMHNQQINWKNQYIEKRREAMVALGEWWIVLEQSDRESSKFAREALSKLRHVLALHQAEWPVVMIDLKNPAYQTSVGNIKALSKTCVEASQDLVKQLRSLPGAGNS